MAKRAEEFVIVHRLEVDDPTNSLGLVSDLNNNGWRSKTPVVLPGGAEGTADELHIPMQPDPSAFNTASEQH